MYIKKKSHVCSLHEFHFECSVNVFFAGGGWGAAPSGYGAVRTFLSHSPPLQYHIPTDIWSDLS